MRLSALVLVAAAAAFAFATLAASKENARARLSTTMPLNAAPGTTVPVRWTVDVPGEKGSRQPFNAIGMFVLLLSRTGASTTTGFATPTAHVDGRYAADVGVPEGGIGGVRLGLRGSTDVLFPIVNDPFTSAGGVRCDVGALRTTLAAFVRAYNRGDLRLLDRLFAPREHFQWYSSPEPGVRLLSAAFKRATLLAYFQQRHRDGDRIELSAFRFNGFDRGELGHFGLNGRRRADSFQGGSWFDFTAKGALDCSRPPAKIALLSLGGPD